MGQYKLHLELQKWKPRKIDPNLNRRLKHGWMVNMPGGLDDITSYPWLFLLETMTWGRWDYLRRTMEAGCLLDEPIPEIEFCTGPGGSFEGEGGGARKHIEECLDLIPKSGSWNGWGNWQYFDYFLDWLLYAFGYHGQPELPREPEGCKGASMRLYQYFNLGWLIAYPWDYFGAILAENRHGQHLGFYPTPMPVVNLMTQITFGKPGDHDTRLLAVNEPCVGTGRMLLYASNYSLLLSGQDINLTCVKATLVNGYLYAPWLVKPPNLSRMALSSPEKDQPLQRPKPLPRPVISRPTLPILSKTSLPRPTI